MHPFLRSNSKNSSQGKRTAPTGHSPRVYGQRERESMLRRRKGVVIFLSKPPPGKRKNRRRRCRNPMEEKQKTRPLERKGSQISSPLAERKSYFSPYQGNGWNLGKSVKKRGGKKLRLI